MTIKNEKKIEVWQFGDEAIEDNIIIDGIVYYLSDEGNYIKRYDAQLNRMCIKHFAKLEAKEQEEESSDWVEFDTPEELRNIGGLKYRTKKGQYFEFYSTFGEWLSTGCFEKVKEYYESNKDAILKANVKPKQEQPASTTDNLLELIHKLEERVEDLEADRSTLVIRTNDIYNRLNSAKLSI